jgi:hypothetical protein
MAAPLLRPMHCAMLWLLISAKGPYATDPGHLDLADCNQVKLGCWQDSKPGDKSPGASGHRVLPYAWCPQGGAIKGQTKTPDNTCAQPAAAVARCAVGSEPAGVPHICLPCVAWLHRDDIWR